jgi:hypothetical protein
VWLYFVTLGKVSKDVCSDAISFAEQASADAHMEVIDEKRARILLRDYLDGVAPPIAALDLEMEQRDDVKVNGVAQRYDKLNDIESWVFTMRGDRVAELFHYAGIRLFARNIRGFLGRNTPVNRGMTATLNSEPDRFIYYNNGVTILCDHAERKAQKGQDILYVRNPQIINGQQTTRTLAEHADLAAKATVLVKVIRVARRLDSNSQFDKLVSQVVVGTNWQNKISPSDLISNDRLQIDLERSLRKLGYAYIRKRQTKGEARRSIGAKHLIFVRKDEFAQAVAACDIDPVVARTGKEKLFEEQLYPRIFSTSDPYYYLSRFWLMKHVNSHLKGAGLKGETRWLILNFLWAKLKPLIKGTQSCREFVEQCQRNDFELRVPLATAIRGAYQVTIRFYKEHRGKGKDAIDMPTFFKSKRAAAKEFQSYCLGQDKLAASLDKQLSKITASINS